MDNFTQKPVANSSLDSNTRDKLAPTAPAPASNPTPTLASGLEDSFFRRNRLYIAIAAIALLVIVVLGFFALRKPSEPAQPKISLVLDVPTEIPSSSEAIVKAVITNNDSVTVANGELELILPQGAVFVSGNPEPLNLSGTRYKVPELPPGANITVFARLKFEGGVGEQRSVQGRLQYKLAGLTADFSAEASGVAKLVAAGVTIDIQGPATATNAQLVNYTLHYSNQSTQTFDRVRAKLIMPQGFQFAQAEPAPSQGSDTWDIGQLAPGAQGDIVVHGTFVSSTPGQSMPLTAQILVPDKNGSFYAQAEGKFVTAINTQPLVVTHALHSVSESSKLVAAPGDVLQYKLDYQNNATTAARGVRVVFTVDSTTADLSSIQAEGAVVSGNTVTWSAASKPELEVLNPNESGSVSVSIKVKEVPVKDRAINPELATSVKIRADEYDTFLTGNKLQVKIATVSAMESSVAFIDGAKPPRVGQTSNYAVTIGFSNTTSDITNATLTLFVGTGGNSFDASSVTSAEAQNVTYDPSTGKLTWRMNTLKAHTGDFAPVRSLKFNVRLVPTSGQIGRPVRLIKDIQFNGIDSNTGSSVTKTETELTTSDASAGSNDGMVSP